MQIDYEKVRLNADARVESLKTFSKELHLLPEGALMLKQGLDYFSNLGKEVNKLDEEAQELVGWAVVCRIRSTGERCRALLEAINNDKVETNLQDLIDITKVNHEHPTTA